MQNVSSMAIESFDWGKAHAGSWTFTTSCGAILHEFGMSHSAGSFSKKSKSGHMRVRKASPLVEKAGEHKYLEFIWPCAHYGICCPS